MQNTKTIPVVRHRQKEIWQDKLFHAVNLFLVALLLLVMLYPLYLVIICSISDANLVSRGLITVVPRGITFTGYQAILENASIWRGYLNSIIYTLLGTLLSLAVTMGSSFALSQRFPGKKVFSLVFVITMFFNGGLIPTFLTVRNIGLYNKPAICVLMGCVSVWNVMLARTYIKTTIPEALYEAAKLDGATQTQIFFKIVLPLCGTIIAVLSVYYGVDRWNDYWTGMIYLKTRDYLPLQTVLKSILASLEASSELLDTMQDFSANDGEILQRAQVAKYCIIVVSTVPAVLLYLVMQKYFVKGVMIGSIKG